MERTERLGPKEIVTISYNYYRFPGPDEDLLDWGELVVGIEKWNDRWLLSYLALYKWTP